MMDRHMVCMKLLLAVKVYNGVNIAGNAKRSIDAVNLGKLKTRRTNCSWQAEDKDN